MPDIYLSDFPFPAYIIPLLLWNRYQQKHSYHCYSFPGIPSCTYIQGLPVYSGKPQSADPSGSGGLIALNAGLFTLTTEIHILFYISSRNLNNIHPTLHFCLHKLLQEGLTDFLNKSFLVTSAYEIHDIPGVQASRT